MSHPPLEPSPVPPALTPFAPTAILLDTIPVGARLALAAAGPIALGAVLGARLGSAAPVIGLPIIVAGVAAITTPALYIATAAIGWAPPARVMGSAVLRALTALGIVLLGLAAPLAFLAATATSMRTGVALGSMTLASAALVGLSALHRALFAGQTRSVVRDSLFAAWALVALIIAARLYLDLVMGVTS